MTTSRVPSAQPPMVCLGSIIQVNNKFCHLDITSQQKFLEALGISTPVDISDLLIPGSTKLKLGDQRRLPMHFGLLVNPSDSCLRIGDFAALDKGLSSSLHDLVRLGESKCHLDVVLDLSLPLECLRLTRIPVAINIYCSAHAELGKDICNILDRKKLYLQHPLSILPDIQYRNPHFLGKVHQSMVGPRESLREAQLRYLILENLAPTEQREGLRFLFQEGRQYDDMKTLRRKIGLATKEEWNELKEIKPVFVEEL
ncbi:hypothetical protein FSARC_8448 [Fusarium sarcochroum]|uniref:Uncharacterized protein n=1 Tax=Fusarium sarcochroum TaxID=1208366 RepID=A0A8H4X6B6_9HYPO|nr:hypothetical protein FSARC_8448 [Fusarium sarcochroum]